MGRIQVVDGLSIGIVLGGYIFLKGFLWAILFFIGWRVLKSI